MAGGNRPYQCRESEFDMVEPQNLKTSTIALAGSVSAVLTFVVIVAVQVLYLQMESAFDRSAAQTDSASRTDQLVAEQEGRLASYAWIDRDQRLVQIPIERAMELTLAETSQERLEADNASTNN